RAITRPPPQPSPGVPEEGVKTGAQRFVDMTVAYALPPRRVGWARDHAAPTPALPRSTGGGSKDGRAAICRYDCGLSPPPEEGQVGVGSRGPHPSPPPEYRRREKDGRAVIRRYEC